MRETLSRTVFFALATLLPLLVSAAPGEPRELPSFTLNAEDRYNIRLETLRTIQYLQQHHYNGTLFSDMEPEEILKAYLSSLDNHHLFFLQSDADDLMARFSTNLLPVYLQQGDLYPAFQIFLTYRERALDRIDWIYNRLEGEFSFDSSEVYRPDRSEEDWPATAEAADDLWERRITFELLQERLNDETLERAIEKVRRRYERTERYIVELEVSNVQEMFLATYAEMYDPHSTYLSADSMEEFSIGMHNSLVGIGAILRPEEGYCVIQDLLPGGPAELSGKLHPGDKIIEVAQEGEEAVDVIDMKLRKIVKMIRGEEGTKVILTIIPAEAGDLAVRRKVVLVRDTVKLTQNLASAEVFEVPVGEDRMIRVGAIELPSFYGSTGRGEAEASTTGDVEELLYKLKGMKVEGLVLDLRRNGGGLLSEAVALTGLFIPKGPVVQVRDHVGRVRPDWDRDAKVAYDGPLIVLVSRRSASASEIVAGALQNHQRALIVGDKSTHGKGTVQAIFDFARENYFRVRGGRNGGAKITIQKFYLPSGDSTQNKGVESDLAIPSINEYLPIGESDLPNALSWDAIRSEDWSRKDYDVFGDALVTPELIVSLNEYSRARRNHLEEFHYLTSHIDWFREGQEKEEYSLNHNLRRQQRDEDNDFKDEMERQFDELSKHRFQQTEILLDVAQSNDDLHQEKLRTQTLPNGKLKSNTYYQGVYYFDPEGADKITEVRVEQFDYEDALKHKERLTKALADSTDIEVSAEEVESIVQSLKSAELTDEFNVARIFREAFGEEAEDTLIPAFFEELIALQPETVDDRPGLDIHLRESLRVMADWVQLIEGDTPVLAAASSEPVSEVARSSDAPSRDGVTAEASVKAN